MWLLILMLLSCNCDAGIIAGFDVAMLTPVREFQNGKDAIWWADMHKNTPNIVGILSKKYMDTLKILDAASDRKDLINVSLLSAQLRYIKGAIEYLESKQVGAEIYMGEEPL